MRLTILYLFLEGGLTALTWTYTF